MNLILYLKKIYKLHTYFISGGVSAYGILYLLFIQGSVGFWLLDIPLMLITGIIVPVGLFCLIALALTDIAEWYGQQRKAGPEYALTALPIYEPLARTRMPKSLKDLLKKNRSREVEQIKEFAAGNSRLLLITGEPGTGKSTLAATIARRADFWLNLCGKEIDPAYLVFQLASWLKDEQLITIATSNATIRDAEIDRIVALASKGKRRIFFNSVEQLLAENGSFEQKSVLKLFRKLLTAPGDHKIILISTLMPSLDELSADNVSTSMLPATGLEAEFSISLLSELVSGNPDEALLEKMAEATKGNPLILSLLSSFTNDAHVERLIENTTWKSESSNAPITSEFLKLASEEAYPLLQKASCIPEPVTESFLTALAGKELDGAKWTKELASRHLLDWDGGLKKYSLHPAVSTSAFHSLQEQKDEIERIHIELINICLAKAEDFKPSRLWAAVSDCRLYVRAADMMIDGKEFAAAANILLQLHEYLIKWKNYRLLERLYEKSFKLWLRHGKNSGEERNLFISILQKFAALEYETGRYDKAAELYEMLRLFAKRLDNEALAFLATSRMTECYRQLGLLSRALATAKAQFDFSQSREKPIIQAAALGRLAHAYGDLGNLSMAEENYLRALSIVRDQENLKLEANTLGYLARLYLRGGDVASAISMLSSKSELADRIGDTDAKLSTLMEMAKTYNLAGQASQAAAVWESAVQLAKDHNNLQVAVEAMTHLSRVAFQNADYARALLHQQDRLAMAEQLKDDLLAGNALGHLGHAYARSKDLENAKKHYALAKKRFVNTNHVNGVSKCCHYLARLHAAENQWKEALEQVLERIDLSLHMETVDLEFDFRLLTLCKQRLGEETYAAFSKDQLGEQRYLAIDNMIS